MVVVPACALVVEVRLSQRGGIGLARPANLLLAVIGGPGARHNGACVVGKKAKTKIKCAGQIQMHTRDETYIVWLSTITLSELLMNCPQDW